MKTKRAVGFDNERYLEAQSRAILERVETFGQKLYLEFGGKLLFDYHAARVLPGYNPNVKVRLLQQLRDKIDIIFCVSAIDIAAGRIRGDFGMTYDLATLRTLDDLRERGLPITAVCINRWEGQEAAQTLKNRVEARGVPVYVCKSIPNYPEDVELICSERGYGANPFIQTTKPIVVVTGAGPGSGKMATALQQVWHELHHGRVAGFSKWETFPIWDLPLEHPVNLAYEAATVDLADYNLVDPWHLEAYGESSVNYNRDVENFPILEALINGVLGVDDTLPRFRSPTDMGVNCASQGIVDDAVVREAARQEIVRRYFRHNWEVTIGIERQETVDLALKLMDRVGVVVEDRKTVLPARQAATQAEDRPGKGYKNAYCGAAMELPSGHIVAGMNSELLYSTAAAVINALKHLAGIPEPIHLLSPLVIRNLVRFKNEVLGEGSDSLDISEALAALSVSAAHNPAAEAAFEMLPVLKECEMHMTHVPTSSDQEVLRKLGIMFTTDALHTPGGYFLK